VSPVELVAAVGDEQKRAHVCQPAGKVVEQFACRRIGPMDVFHDQQQAVLTGRHG